MYAITNATKYWTPYFDNFNFVANFEHHTHHKKFTKRIKNNTVCKDEELGTRYVGDGSWGVIEGSCDSDRITKQPEKFEFFDTK